MIAFNVIFISLIHLFIHSFFLHFLSGGGGDKVLSFFYVVLPSILQIPYP